MGSEYARRHLRMQLIAAVRTAQVQLLLNFLKLMSYKQFMRLSPETQHTLIFRVQIIKTNTVCNLDPERVVSTCEWLWQEKQHIAGNAIYTRTNRERYCSDLNFNKYGVHASMSQAGTWSELIWYLSVNLGYAPRDEWKNNTFASLCRSGQADFFPMRRNFLKNSMD